jgi:hypothetical protein
MSMPTEIEHYGEVLHSKILEIFGDDMTYNELEIYTRNKNDKSYLQIEFYDTPYEVDFTFMSVVINKQVLKILQFKKDTSYDTFHKLRTLYQTIHQTN